MKKSLFLALCASTVLAACGGLNDDTPPPPVTSEVPASASMSVTGFVDYLRALVVAAADTLEPVDVSAVMPPTDDTIGPTVVD